ncbi:glutaminase liver isoform, mitochondrial-like isoform X3 [Oratosquilla oratoria]|uniref:glutaminase liver isoform, mitochondrial-like isoform X3 n=1 Tax=Oratosquilla oratoria TaxID=337810 RepID=UPI003F7719B2
MQQVGRALRRAGTTSSAAWTATRVEIALPMSPCTNVTLNAMPGTRPPASSPMPVHALLGCARRPVHSTSSDTSSWRESICISVDCDDDNPSPQNVEDLLFNLFREDVEDKMHVGKFLAALTDTGLRKTDPRLREMRQNLMAVHAQMENRETTTPTSLYLDRETFKDSRRDRAARSSLERSFNMFRAPVTSLTSLKLSRKEFRKVVKDNIVLISKALRNQFVIPEFADFCKYINDFYYNCKEIEEGKVASYIPQLARFSKDRWAVSVCTVDGQRYSVGDTGTHFTMQSCSKPIMYAIALNELGADTVHKYVGQEPSGRMFNALVLDYNNKPHNPLVNAGSIVINALLNSLIHPEMSSSEKFDFVQQYFQRMAGEDSVGFSNGTFLSERDHADRNYALGYYMRENRCFPEKCDLMSSLDLYFQSCSMEVTSDSMSVMAATLANGGICPVTGDRVVQPNAVRDVLSLMHSCGMYDYSGQFAFKVGLPAKSGVCGAVMLVIPNVMGICAWSPPLDALGNSVRGLKFCEELVQMFNFHRYDNLKHAVNKKDPRKKKFESRGQKVVSLLFSASAGDVTAMRRYALAGINMSESDYDGRTALHLASAEGHLETVLFLLEKCKVSPTPKDRWGHTPTDDAVQFGHAEVAKVLQEHAEKEKQERREKANDHVEMNALIEKPEETKEE